MRTLASELGLHVEKSTSQPRIYADANVPAGVILYMRRRLKWDVLAVVEDDTLRRASDHEHYQTAAIFRRTLVSLDADFLDDSHFSPSSGSGVIILSAPDERGLIRLLRKIDKVFFAKRFREDPFFGLPLDGQKLQVHPDWTHDISSSHPPVTKGSLNL